MNRSRLIVAALLGVVGLVWIGQGLGYIGGSFMTRDLKWAVIGAVVLMGAIGLAASARRSEP